MVGAATFAETFAGILEGGDIVAHCRNQHAESYYDRLLADPAAAAWVAEVEPGRAAVGYALLTPADLPLPDISADDLEVKRIYVFSRFHGGGHGRRLMEAAVEEARGRGAPRVLLGVYAGNDRAIAFYRRQGFEPVGERSFLVGSNRYHDLVLAKAL